MPMEEQTDTGENAHRNGLFWHGLEIRGLGGLNGGVRSPMRTGLSPPALLFPVICIFSGTRIPAFAVGGCFSA